MKYVPCSYDKCYLRRPHFLLQDEVRTQQMVQVADEYDGPAYCSYTCAIMDGKMSVKSDQKYDIPPDSKWLRKNDGN